MRARVRKNAKLFWRARARTQDTHNKPPTMGKHTRRDRKKDHIKKQECPVCFEAFSMHGEDPDNVIFCGSGHAICTTCVQKLIKPGPICCSTCIGFQYSCPICRKLACLSKKHLLVVQKHSWQKMYALFACPHELQEWATCKEEEEDP